MVSGDGCANDDLSPEMGHTPMRVDAREVALPSDVGLNVDVEAAPMTAFPSPHRLVAGEDERRRP